MLIVIRPQGQPVYRFRASSLHWRNLRNGFPVAVSAVGALVRNNVPASVFVALTVAAICGMWLGSRIDSPELVLSSVSLLLLVLFLLVPFHSLAAKEPTILIGAVPAFAIATSYILVVEPRLALLSVGPAVIFLGAWIPTQYMLLQLRKRWILAKAVQSPDASPTRNDMSDKVKDDRPIRRGQVVCGADELERSIVYQDPVTG